MKTLVRLMSVCSLVTAAFVTPVVASAGTEQVGSESEEVHASKEKIFDNSIEAARLRPDQKQEVDRLKTEWRDRHAPVRKAKIELMGAFATQLEKLEDIDRCALASQVKDIGTAMAKTRPQDRASMETLHSILDRDQRFRFAESMRQQLDELDRAHEANAIVDRMARRLGLRDEQKLRLREILSGLRQIHRAEPAFIEHRERMRKILDAFKGERFVLDEIAPIPKDLERRLTRRVAARLWASEAVIPVLDQEQRVKLATWVRDEARHEGAGGHHGQKGTHARPIGGAPEPEPGEE